ncbi:glycosyltransferase family 77 protein [Micromonas commoda]|uniref:Glycosyltransferase family 77 protein n=1 Tax=Micromonas commoda (strain RCC299 / NOUM17 / CCMP2709) TaxID=296587 RepID=C1E205_MICCC|nr:glycosyltransferase family 77 protein [Micromonas commoda]ACO61836.1 glycosyltransferase family 77 protein [Micromonas commoda]|eukprot:XP_002500578.1 glycosyltransferase family 77 protein [Micromonas commoda]
MQEVDPSKQDHPKWMRDMWSEKVQAVDKNVIDKELEARLESRPPELDHVQPGEELFVTFGTASVTDFVQNWLESADKLGLSPLFVGALDEDMYEWCKKRGVPSMLLKGNTVLKNRGQQFITAGDKSFKKMGTVKTKFIQDLLELGIAPILTDADVVWLKDPRSYFKRGTYITADVLVSTDCIDVPADRKDNNGCSHVNFNTGVLHFRPTDAAKAFVQTWKTKVATSTIAWMRDQPAFNLITHEGVGGHSLEPAVSVPEERRGTEGHRMVYWAANASIRLGVLPNWLFGNGHSYFVQWHHLTHPEDGEPFSVHLTYQYGDTGSYAFGKRERMRQAGIWRSDPREYFEDGKYLVVSDEGSQVDFSGESPGGEEVGSDRNAYRTAIDRHLREDKLRRTTIRNALALARALNRILVLPEARCYCDKIWNNLNACRAPGAESFKLPYACPMDHIYDLPSWFNPGMPDFREPGFLDDPRVPDAIKASVGRVVVDRDGDTRAGKPGWDMNDGKVVKLRHGFTVPDAKLALKSLEEKRVIEVDFLGNEGTFCGFGDDAKNKEFDRIVVKPLSASQYYCFTELWEDQGSPRGGRNGPYEPQVVLRHCGMMEDDFKRAGKVHAGVVEHIDKPDGGCSCEWGFGLPRGLAHISKDESICPRRNSDQPTAG